MTKRNLVTLICVLVSGMLQAYIIQTFMRPLALISSGFTGLAILIETTTKSFWGFSFPVSLGMVLLNVPVALLCGRTISRRFVLFSLLQVGISSLCLQVFHFNPVFSDRLLNIVFGGFSYGVMVLIALKGNASTGGTDFIALYVSTKIGKNIWFGIFVGNVVVITLYGLTAGWHQAGYSILFQLIATKTVDSFYHRFEQVTLQITTQHPDRLIEAYVACYRHGLSRLDGVGGYSGKPVSLLHTVVSSYEVHDIIQLFQSLDPQVIINTFKTVNFYGSFYRQPIG